MPETIVYNLEVVQIHEHDRDGLLTPLGARECMPEAVREQDTVGQLSQGIMRGLVGKLLLEGLASGDVAADEYNRLLRQWRDGALEPYLPTLYRQAVLYFFRLSALKRAPDVAVKFLGLLGRQDLIERLADQFFAGLVEK